jgi:hypothetical protein
MMRSSLPCTRKKEEREELLVVSKEELKDWLNENARKNYASKLEDFIDRQIKANALSGNTSFYISTGEYTRDGSKKTPFYQLWNTAELSEENKKIVQESVVGKYKEFGFSIEKTSVDCGWHNHYFALKFNDIHKVLVES